MDQLRNAFKDIEQKAYDAAFAAAHKKVKAAKVETKTRTKGGRYNGIPLSFVPYAIVRVNDAGKPVLKWAIVGQTVTATGRNFAAPVVIEYITVKEHKIWFEAMIAAVQKELSK